MNSRPLTKHILLSGLIGLLGLLAAYLGSSFLLLYPALLGFALAAFGGVCFLLSALMAVAGIALLYVWDWSLAVLLATLLLSSGILGLGLKRQLPYRYMAVGCAVVFALFQYACLCLPSLLAGLGPFTYMEGYMAEFMVSFTAIYEATGLSLPSSTTSYILSIVPEIAVLTILLPAMFFGFVDLLLCRFLCKKAGTALRPMAQLSLWKLPRSFLGGTGILIAGAVTVTLLNLRDAGAISMAIECVLLLPYALAGFAFTEFNQMVVKKDTRGRRVLSYALYLILLPYSLFFLALMGVLDLAIRLRDRYIENQNQQ